MTETTLVDEPDAMGEGDPSIEEEPRASAVEDGPDIDLNVNDGDPLPLDDFDDGQDG